MIAALMGRSRKRPLRKDWEAVKDRIMHEAVLAKLTQHADLRETLYPGREALAPWREQRRCGDRPVAKGDCTQHGAPQVVWPRTGTVGGVPQAIPGGN